MLNHSPGFIGAINVIPSAIARHHVDAVVRVPAVGLISAPPGHAGAAPAVGVRVEGAAGWVFCVTRINRLIQYHVNMRRRF